MGRRKIEIKEIPHRRNRKVTFSKRKEGLFKKAYELATLCGVDVDVTIHDEEKNWHRYSSKDVSQDILERYNNGSRDETQSPLSSADGPESCRDEVALLKDDQTERFMSGRTTSISPQLHLHKKRRGPDFNLERIKTSPYYLADDNIQAMPARSSSPGNKLEAKLDPSPPLSSFLSKYPPSPRTFL